MDVLQDGTGIETAGWFRSSREGIGKDATNTDDSVVMSRLCALHWVIVLYESVVPDQLKADVSTRSIDNDDSFADFIAFFAHTPFSTRESLFLPLSTKWQTTLLKRS